MKPFAHATLAILAAAQTAAFVAHAEPPVAGLTLAFEETFDAIDLGGRDRGAHRWHFLNSLGMRANPNLLRLKDGVLTLQTPTDKRWGANTSIATAPDWPNSGSATTPLFGPGYFEARIRFDPKKGHWPAFWMYPPLGLEHATGRIAKSVEGAWCEIDIMEGLSPTTYGGSVHDWMSGAKPHDIYNKNNNTIHVPAGTDFRAWNVFGVRWTPETITWFFNDQKMSSIPTPEICRSARLFLIVGAQTQGGEDRHEIDVDWIRAYQ